MERIILASGSPTRKLLLGQLGVSFEIKPSDIDEDGHTEEDPATRALHLAVLKAEKCHRENPGAWIIGCDTLVVAHDGMRLEKPVDAEDERRMLRLHSGHCSLVHSGLCVIAPDGSVQQGIQTTKVYFKELSDDEIDALIANEYFWRGRSGGFEIDGPGQLLIERIDGDWTSVMGLPVFLLGQLFAKAGRPLHTLIKP